VAESATMAIMVQAPPLTPDQVRKGAAMAGRVWAENGFTTACELGLGLSGDDADLIKVIIDEKLLPMDLVVYIKYSVVEAAERARREIADKYQGQEVGQGAGPRYINRVRAEGIKFWVRE